MLIKCKQIRTGGTEILMGEVTYHFAPNKDGDHVAEVTDKAHIERFLSITEGFEAHGKAAAEKPAQADASLDVSTMGKEKLLAIGADHGLALNNAAHVSALRKQVAKALGL